MEHKYLKTVQVNFVVNTVCTAVLAGNALARVQRVHEPADLWDITFCTR
jgi:hypothetical protein